jgi:O-antigen/teichoic acid export membrane protein
LVCSWRNCGEYRRYDPGDHRQQLGAGASADRPRDPRSGNFRLVVLSLPLAAIFAATAPSLIASLFGKGFEMSGAAILLVLAGWPLVIIYLASSVLTAADRAGTAAAIAVLTIPIALAGYAAFIPRWHTAGAAAVTLFAFSVCAAVYVAAMDRRLSITWPWRAFAIASLLGAGSFGLVHRFGGTVVTDVVLGTTAGLLSLAALIATRTITADDLAAVRSLALKRHSAETS